MVGCALKKSTLSPRRNSAGANSGRAMCWCLHAVLPCSWHPCPRKVLAFQRGMFVTVILNVHIDWAPACSAFTKCIQEGLVRVCLKEILLTQSALSVQPVNGKGPHYFCRRWSLAGWLLMLNRLAFVGLRYPEDLGLCLSVPVCVCVCVCPPISSSFVFLLLQDVNCSYLPLRSAQAVATAVLW